MRRDRSHPVDAVPLLIAGWLVVVLAGVWGARMAYPYDLEWMEGGMLAHAWRLEHGLPLYPEPGRDFVPFIYPPGYPALLAALPFELSHALGRAVSLLSTLAAAAAIAFAVGRNGRSWTLGLLGGIVFLGCYPHSGAFYDLVRNEALFVALLGWSIALALERRRGAAEAAGLLLAAAFLVKHNAALFGIPLAAGLAVRDGWRDGLRFGLWAAVPAGLATLWLQWRTEGRFVTYILEVPASHPMVAGRLFPGTPWELGEALPVAFVATAAFFAWWTSRRAGSVAIAAALTAAALGAFVGFEIPASRDHVLSGLVAMGFGLDAVKGIGRFGPWLSMAALGSVAAALVTSVVALASPARKNGDLVLGVGLLATSFVAATLMRGHHGGFVNVHMQAHWTIALAFAFALARARELAPWATPAGALLVSAQLAWAIGTFEPAKYVPTAEDREVGDDVVAILREAPGPVLSPFAPWLPAQAGHEPSFHLIALWDVADHDRTPFPGFRVDFEDALRGHHWGTIVDGTRSMAHGVNKHYRASKRLPGGAGVFVPKTGWRTRPGVLLVPRGAAGDPSDDDAG